MPHELLKRAAANGTPFAWLAVTMGAGRWAASAGNQGALPEDLEELHIYARVAHALGAPDVLGDLAPRPPIKCDPADFMVDLMYGCQRALCDNMLSGVVAVAAMHKMGVVHHMSSTCPNRPSIQNDGPVQLISTAIVALSEKIKRCPAIYFGRKVS